MSEHNEIFCELDALDIAQSIRQEREEFSGCFLIVEGKSDDRALKFFIDEAVCSLQVVGNKKIAQEVLTELENEGFEGEGVVCIIDTDYEYVSAHKKDSSNIIETGVHDLDVAIVCTSAF